MEILYHHNHDKMASLYILDINWHQEDTCALLTFMLMQHAANKTVKIKHAYMNVRLYISVIISFFGHDN